MPEQKPADDELHRWRKKFRRDLQKLLKSQEQLRDSQVRFREEQAKSAARFDEAMKEIRKIGEDSDGRLKALIKAVGGIDQERPQ